MLLGKLPLLLLPAACNLLTFDGLYNTSGKKGFHSPPLVPNLFDPRLKGPSISVHLKMWAKGH
jgi:hypothetical protein